MDATTDENAPDDNDDDDDDETIRKLTAIMLQDTARIRSEFLRIFHAKSVRLDSCWTAREEIRATEAICTHNNIIQSDLLIRI